MGRWSGIERAEIGVNGCYVWWTLASQTIINLSNHWRECPNEERSDEE